MLFSLLIFGAASCVIHAENVTESHNIPLFLSPLDGEGPNVLPRSKHGHPQDDNHDNFRNVDNEYLGVESVKILPPPEALDVNETLSDDIPNDIEEELVAFSDFFPFPPSDVKMKIEDLAKDLREESKLKGSRNFQIVPFLFKNKTLDASGSESSQIVLVPRPFYPSWPIQEEPTSFEKSSKAITLLGEPRSTSPSDFNAILFTKTRSPIVIVEAPNLAVIGKTAPRYRTPSGRPFNVPHGFKPRKKPLQRLKLHKLRFPKSRKPKFGRNAYQRGFFGKKRRVRQFHFNPSYPYYG